MYILQWHWVFFGSVAPNERTLTCFSCNLVQSICVDIWKGGATWADAILLFCSCAFLLCCFAFLLFCPDALVKTTRVRLFGKPDSRHRTADMVKDIDRRTALLHEQWGIRCQRYACVSEGCTFTCIDICICEWVGNTTAVRILAIRCDFYWNVSYFDKNIRWQLVGTLVLIPCEFLTEWNKFLTTLID